MTCTKKNCLFAVNSILPLLFGLFIYLTVSEETLIASLLPVLRSLLPVIDYPAVIRNFAADFLWTYAMFFCLRLALGDDLCGKHNLSVLLLTCAAAVAIECLQMTGVFHGTFDMLDIVTELTAASAALLISNIIERRNKCNEEK